MESQPRPRENYRPAEEQIMQTEGGHYERVASQARERMKGYEKMKQLLAAISGEEMLRKLDVTAPIEEQILAIQKVLKQSPFIKKLVPDDLPDANSQAAFIAGVIQEQVELQNQMN